MLNLDLSLNEITSVGVRALVDDNVEAVKTLTELCLPCNAIRSEGATIIADALGRNAMPNLKRLNLESCSIDDDGFVALASALQQNTSLQILDLQGNEFGEHGFMALAESLENIKGLQQITITANANMPLLLDGFRKNTSLAKVTIGRCEPGEWSQELKFLGHRNRFTPLLKASGSPAASPQLGIWSRALAMVATEPDVLFPVQGRQVPRIQRVNPRSTLVLQFFRQRHSSRHTVACPRTFRGAHGLGHCLTKRGFDMRVQVVPRLFLSSIQDPVRGGISPVTHHVGHDVAVAQCLFPVRVGMTGGLIEGGTREWHEGQMDWFKLFRLLIPFGSNGERELATRNSEQSELDPAVCKWNGLYFDMVIASIMLVSDSSTGEARMHSRELSKICK